MILSVPVFFWLLHHSDVWFVRFTSIPLRILHYCGWLSPTPPDSPFTRVQTAGRVIGPPFLDKGHLWKSWAWLRCWRFPMTGWSLFQATENQTLKNWDFPEVLVLRVIKWGLGPDFSGGSNNANVCKCMVVLRDFPYNSALFGVEI